MSEKVIVFCLTERGYREKYYLYAEFARIRARNLRYILYMSQVNTSNLKQSAERYLRYLPFLLALIIWSVLTFKEHYYLKKVEDLSLFLFDGRFIVDSFSTPGGFLGLAGAFFTQFLHLPWLGSLIWVAFLLLSYRLTIRAFRIPESLAPLALLPVALLVIYNMSLGYGVYIMREQDHFFAPVLGYITALIPLIAVRNIKPVWGKILLIAVWSAAGYPLLGTFAFVGTLSASCFMLVDQEQSRRNRLTLFFIGLALIIVVPLVLYGFYTSYRLTDSWEMGLPFTSEEAWIRPTRVPLQLALLFIPVMSLVSHRLKDKSADIIIQLSAYIVAIAAVWGFWYKDENFHTELAMSDAVDRSAWQEVIDIYRKATVSSSRSDAKAYAARTKKLVNADDENEINDIIDRYENRFFEPTRTMVMYRDLALLKMNRALDEAFSMKDGSRLQKSRTQIPMAMQAGKQFYLQYGLVNMCYRWCLEDAVEHGWNYSTLKYITMHAVTMQDGDLANKYTGKLGKTLFYRKWADAQKALGSDPEAMAAAQPYKSILPLRCFEDRMTNDMGKTETFVISHFLNQQPMTPSPEYDRAALFFAMRIQDIPTFWERLLYYVDSNDFKVLPRSVQEAAYLYSTLEKRANSLPIDDKIKEGYDSFNRYVQSHPIRSMKESSYPYSQKFGKTYFYFYYFIRNLQTY